MAGIINDVFEGLAVSVSGNVTSTAGTLVVNSPVTVANGGTGVASTTAYAVLCGGTTSTNPLQSIASVGTSGQILTSNGAGALPTFQAAAASSITITADSGGSAVGNSFTLTGTSIAAGNTVKFIRSGTTLTLDFTDTKNNTALGGVAMDGETGCDFNTAIGSSCMNGVINSDNNTVVGYNAMPGASGCTSNTIIGYQTCSGGITSSANNVVIGRQSANALNISSYNVIVGSNIGNSYTNLESHNILINAAGVNAESNTLRIGNGAGTGTQQLNRAFIHGINGITNTAASSVVLIDTNGQLGTDPGGATTFNTGTDALSISNDASATTVTIATGAAVKTVTVGSTNSTSATTVQSGSGALALTSTNGTWTGNSGTGALGLSTDASATTVSLATGGAVKTVTLGSTNSTSATTVQSGSGALAVTSTNGTLTINSGTGALSISNDASATTVTIATGAAVKTTTLGSTNSTSATTIQSGSNPVTITTNGSNANIVLTPNGTGRITSTKNMNVAGISFDSGTTTMSTYLTGTWTPTLRFGGLSTGITYSTRTGVYTQIGNTVLWAMTIILTNKGSATGTATITGFPVAHGATDTLTVCPLLFNNVAFTAPIMWLQTDILNLANMVTTSAIVLITDVAFANNSQVYASGSLIVA